MRYVTGVDVGTSGTKTLLVNETGKVCGTGYATYPLHQEQPGWAEQNPADWWEATCTSIRQALQDAGVSPRAVQAVGVSGQMHGMVCLDKHHQVIRPAILWCDTRTTAACRWITEVVGEAELPAITGNVALEGFTAPKLVWLAKHEPAHLEKTATLLLPKDYINYKLTDQLATDRSDAAGSLLYNVIEKQWALDLVQRLQLPTQILPPVYPSWEAIGRLTEAAALATGLLPGTVVVAGGADNACGAVGAGVLHTGQALSSIGSSGVILTPIEQPPARIDGKLHLFNHAVDTWYFMGVMLAAGLSYRWARDELGVAGESYDELNTAAASVAPGAEGVVFLPYLNGERTPHADPHARGVFFGISAVHQRAHLIRAVMEGITYGLRDIIELMRAAGPTIQTLRAIGGGAKSALWLQMQADVLQATVEVPAVDEGPAYGAALLAGVGSGVFSSVFEAVHKTVRVKAEYVPNAAASAAYERSYAVYRRLYPALKETFRAAAT
ncbi:MAG: xylulokinase [Limnochordia bacterium]